jgi:hypothetical protein
MHVNELTESVLESLWLYRRTFFAVALGIFATLTVLIFLIPKNFAIRSSIEVGATLINDKLEPLESPEQVARQINSSYVTAALLAAAEKGATPQALVTLQNTKAEAVGRAILLQAVAETTLEGDSKDFQQTIIEQVIKDRVSFMQGMRDGFRIRIESARRSAAALEEQATLITRQLDDTAARRQSLQRQIEAFQTDLAGKYQRAAATADPAERIIVEAEIRELREQIASGTAVDRELMTDRSNSIRALIDLTRLKEEQIRTLGLAERDQRMTTDTRILLAPSLVPLPIRPPRIYLLLGALVVSCLLALGIVVFLYSQAERQAAKRRAA